MSELLFDEEIVKNLFSDYTIIPQFKVCVNSKNYFIDWYIKELNLAIEYDEPHHKHQKKIDEEREEQIKNALGCKFIRYKSYKYRKPSAPLEKWCVIREFAKQEAHIIHTDEKRFELSFDNDNNLLFANSLNNGNHYVFTDASNEEFDYIYDALMHTICYTTDDYEDVLKDNNQAIKIGIDKALKS